MVKLTVLSAIFFTVGVLPTALARPQDVGASATTVPGSASTATPDAKTEENNRDFVPGVEAVVNTYTLDGVLQEVHLMKPGICYFLPDSVGKLTYKVAGPKLGKYIQQPYSMMGILTALRH
jgi:hypothetical protein